MLNDTVLIESQSMREEYVARVEVLDKVKQLAMLPGDLHASIEMTASYYEVNKEVINSVVKDHRKELERDGLKVLRGEELMSLKDMGVIGKNAASFTVIPRRAILRIGMLLRDSIPAQQIRTYLLNVEEVAREKAPDIISEAIERIDWHGIITAVGCKTELGSILGIPESTNKMIALRHTEREFCIDLGEWKVQLREDDTERTYSPTELGDLMNPPLKGHTVNDLLESAGLQTRIKKGKRTSWELTDKGQKYAQKIPVEINKRDAGVTSMKFTIRWRKSVLEQLTVQPV